MQEDNTAIRRHVRHVTGIPIVKRLKMIDQICQIESFRQDVERCDGHKLSGEEAAREWVGKYAGEFSALNY